MSNCEKTASKKYLSDICMCKYIAFNGVCILSAISFDLLVFSSNLHSVCSFQQHPPFFYIKKKKNS